MTSTTRLTVAAAFAGLAAGALAAQQPQTPPPAPPPAAAESQEDQPPPRFRAEASFVRVDAYPTENGRPVMDLRAGDFEVLENGAPQAIQTFEHVVVTPAGPQNLLSEPGTVRAGEQAAANPRNRVFVFFLDPHHVAFEGAHRVNQPLITLMDRVLGPDDLVAVMTPAMSAGQITFGRKTEVIADVLADRWEWGLRGRQRPHDQREMEYEACYPNQPQERLLELMKARRRERIVLDALHDLVGYLGGVREERKAILAVTEGWLLFRPDASLMSLHGDERIPGTEPVGVDSTGRLRVGGNRDRTGNPASLTDCDRERMHLASLDNDQHFRDLMDAANRNNASFYPIDPRGLTVFDSPLGPEAPPDIRTDMARARHRTEVLRTLADNTDGLAVVDTNDLDAGVRRIADDLTSYYLLGYYSTNALDGGYRKITVRVKRPRVQVRARRGYRAATAEEVRASRAASAAPVPEHVRVTTSALGTLDRLRPEQRFSINAVPMREAAGGPVTAVWVVGEVRGPLQDFAAGGTAAIELTGGAAASATAAIPPGERAFLVKVPLAGSEAPIDVRARLTAGKGGDIPLSDSARVETGPGAVRPLVFRRGPSTGNRLQPAGDFRFSRTERLRLELPLPGEAAPGTGRVVDRNGQPLQIPVQVAERRDEGGRWLTADVTLAALGAGDYVVEVTYSAAGTAHTVVTAIRVTR